MIYVKRDPSKIPTELIERAEDAKLELDKLPPDQRIAFIQKKDKIWKDFKATLKAMSYDKCWYSETKDVQSFADVDHFRPKSEARRADRSVDEGYPWLAFDWKNFRYAAERCNRLSKDEETGETQGKSSWFPLAEASPKASWDNRCLEAEMPLLLDPTEPDDMRLIEVSADGLIVPSSVCVGTNLLRVEWTVKCFGLNLPGLRDARLEAMKRISDMVDQMLKTIEAGLKINPNIADDLPIKEQRKSITESALPNSPYSLAAFAQIRLKMPALLPTHADYDALSAT